MRLIYTGQEFPKSFEKSIFLAGPSPRSKEEHSWRPEMIRCLEEAGYDGVIFVPEYSPEDQYNCAASYESVADWEKQGLDMADVIIFWVDRDLESGRYGLTTNIEYGERVKSGKTLLGWDPLCDKYEALQKRAEFYCEEVFYTDMYGLAERAVERIGRGALRTEGERYIPIDLWMKESWQNWLQSQSAVGNKLKWADVKWTFQVGPQRFLFMWVVHVHVWIQSEDRIKFNEVIIGRPDISTIVLLNGDLTSRKSSEINVVLVREFRSPVRNSESFVYENPGGSSFKENQDINVVAAHEVEEETGLEIDPSRIIKIGSRQIASTLTTHKSHVFACVLTDEEFRKLSNDQVVRGVEEDTERTFVETCSIEDLLERDLVDWSQIGMIYQALEVVKKEIS
jgi:8-oxo-dGTP pyrophosphatase MutT (NUDIX family)